MGDRFLSSEEYDERAHSLYNEGDYDGALETLKEGLALYPNAIELYVGLGHARLAREEFAWARLAFEHALVLDPGHEDAMVGMGEVLLRLGRARDGIEYFRRVEALGYGDDADLMLTMGRALHREGFFTEARGLFQRLTSARPECAEGVASIGYSLHRLGEELEACRHLRRALRIDPDLHEARTYLAHLLYDRGDWEGSLREFERIPPSEQWDSLAAWRVAELLRYVRGVGDGDAALRPWSERLEQLEALEWDPIEQLLAEVEARATGGTPGGVRDRNQLELFIGPDEGEPPPMLCARLPGGKVVRGDPYQVVCQFRDHLGFSHEALVPFMRRMAERWLEQHGVEVLSADPGSFLRSAAEFGLIHLTSGSGDGESNSSTSGV